MTDSERIKFIQDNSIRISHRENGFWSAEIPHGTWVSRATFVEALDELHKLLTFTREHAMEAMIEVGKWEVDLKAEHARLYNNTPKGG